MCFRTALSLFLNEPFLGFFFLSGQTCRFFLFWCSSCSSETRSRAVLQLLEQQRRAVLSFKARKQTPEQEDGVFQNSRVSETRAPRTPSGSSKQRTPERSSRVEEPLAVLQRTPERRSSEHQSEEAANTRAKKQRTPERRSSEHQSGSSALKRWCVSEESFLLEEPQEWCCSEQTVCFKKHWWCSAFQNRSSFLKQ